MHAKTIWLTSCLMLTGATLLILGPVSAEPSPAREAKSVKLESLTGLWTGTVHRENLQPEDYNQELILRIDEDGSFFCPTHDLVWLQDDAPSTGTIMQAEDMLTFWAPGKVGSQGHLFRYQLVLREERNPDTLPRLYLLDKPHGIAIHLTRVEGI